MKLFDENGDDAKRPDGPRSRQSHRFTRRERRVAWAAVGLLLLGFLLELASGTSRDTTIVYWGAGVSAVGFGLIALVVTRSFA